MATSVILKKLSWTMEEGFIGKWRKHEGEMVEEGEVLCEVETEKATDELQAPASGTLLKIVFAEGTIAPVNSVIAVIGSKGEDISSILEAHVTQEGPAVPPQAEVAGRVQSPEVPKTFAATAPISPSARRVARERGVDLNRVTGTGPGGRIVSEDVLKAASQPETVSAPQKTISLSGHRKIIADRLSLSARTAVHVPITMEVDMTAANKFKEELQKAGTDISFTDLIVKAAAMALTEFPRTNSMLLGNELRTMNEVNVGLAVGTEDDLLVPVIKNANRLTVAQIAAQIKTMTERARNHALTIKEMSEGTFTVSNLGMFGDVGLFAPIINPPETAILGVGRALPKPVAIDGAIAVRPMVTMTLVFDHRVIDGMYATRFLQRVKEYIVSPQSLTAQ